MSFKRIFIAEVSVQFFKFLLSSRRLEWNLKVQNFKLSQEKKIVAEIDSLRRSKKPLM